MSVKPKWVSQYLDETARKWLIKPRRCNKCSAWCLCVRLCDEYGDTFEELFDPEVLATPREVVTARVLERTIALKYNVCSLITTHHENNTSRHLGIIFSIEKA